MTSKRLFTLLAIASAPLSQAADDWGDIWLSANTASIELNEATSTKSNFEVRLADSDTVEYVRFSQKFYTNLKNGWKLGTHPVFENSKKGKDWNSTYRLDLELNPGKFTLGENGPSISMRNRWELRWKEGQGSEIFHRLRQYTKATWKIDAGPFKSYSLGNELFFEEDKGQLTMNRFYPIQLDTKPTDKLSIGYFLLYQSKRIGSTSNWSGAYILGASFSL